MPGDVDDDDAGPGGSAGVGDELDAGDGRLEAGAVHQVGDEGGHPRHTECTAFIHVALPTPHRTWRSWSSPPSPPGRSAKRSTIRP